MNKTLWKEHGLRHKHTSEFTSKTMNRTHTPWHQLQKSERRAIIQHGQSCKHYTNIFLGFFIITVVIASAITIRKEFKPAMTSQYHTLTFNAKA